jgi:hypothetical protein
MLSRNIHIRALTPLIRCCCRIMLSKMDYRLKTQLSRSQCSGFRVHCLGFYFSFVTVGRWHLFHTTFCLFFVFPNCLFLSFANKQYSLSVRCPNALSPLLVSYLLFHALRLARWATATRSTNPKFQAENTHGSKCMRTRFVDCMKLLLQTSPVMRGPVTYTCPKHKRVDNYLYSRSCAKFHTLKYSASLGLLK